MDASRINTCAPPDVDATLRALRLLGDALGLTVAYHYQGRFHFKLSDCWTLAVKPESAGRFRVEACRWSRARCTLWSFEGDDGRLVSLARELQDVVTRTETSVA